MNLNFLEQLAVNDYWNTNHQNPYYDEQVIFETLFSTMKSKVMNLRNLLSCYEYVMILLLLKKVVNLNERCYDDDNIIFIWTLIRSITIMKRNTTCIRVR